MENKEYKDLGTMNNWEARIWTMPDGSKRIEKEDTTPAEYKECVRLRHMCNGHVTSVKIGNCYHACYCHLCKIQYKVDSSD
jgi:hypothetical protein